jgi:hypothetical protein
MIIRYIFYCVGLFWYYRWYTYSNDNSIRTTRTIKE